MLRDSGVILNTNWSVDLLHNYTSLLRKDSRSIIRGPYYYYIRMQETGYICNIVLPTSSPKRFFRGPMKKTKDSAQKFAAFSAIIELY